MNLPQLRKLMKRNYMVSLLLAIAVFIASVFLSVRFRPDGFEMFMNSVPLNTYHMHPAWPSYEMNNREFMALFQKAFDSPACRLPVAAKGGLVDYKEAEIQGLLAWFGLKLKEIHPNFEIVLHEVLRVTQEATGARVYALDVLVHRLGAYHGKHLHIVVEKHDRKGYQMRAAQLLGEVAEEKIRAPVDSYDARTSPVYASVMPVAAEIPQRRS